MRTEQMSQAPFGAYTADTCPDRAKHTSVPSGYLAWHEWAEKKARTHVQQPCPTCGYLVIWKPKKKSVVLASRGGEAKLVSLIREAAPFVNAVAVMAEDKSKALGWLAEAALTVATPDAEYICGATYCDDLACTTHGPRRDDA